MITKAEIARRQLGTALSLYLEDRDPVSVHCLACGGAEIAETLAAAAGKPKFRSFALESYPQMTDRSYTELKNRFWNALKHAKTRNGQPRDDASLLSEFSEHENEIRLFIGWTDYGSAVKLLPVAAQVYNAWFLALDLSKFVGEEPERFAAQLNREFPGLARLTPTRRKERLRQAIKKYERDVRLLANPVTDPRPLVLGPL